VNNLVFGDQFLTLTIWTHATGDDAADVTTGVCVWWRV